MKCPLMNLSHFQVFVAVESIIVCVESIPAQDMWDVERDRDEVCDAKH